MSRDVFVDTGVWIAHVHRRDRMHSKAAEWFTGLASDRGTRLWTSDYVVAEALNYFRRRVPHEELIDRFVASVFGAPDVPPAVHQILHVHGPRFAEALELYRARFGQGLSLTDWTNVVLMREHGIPEIASFDSGFAAVVDLTPGLQP